MSAGQAAVGPARRAMIVTADDFGLHARVNEAVERAHRNGVLTSASLMVAGDAAADAVERARRLPTLRVGLHVVLADGRATSPRSDIPQLVDDHGYFGNAMVRDGVRFFFLPRVRTQLAHEIRAQFKAFAATGLPLDHVNTHKHFHLHPTVLSLLLEIGREYGMRSMRLPYEPGGSLALRPWIALVRARLDRCGIAHNDHVAGLAQSGRMDELAFIKALGTLPDGVNEIYCHPAIPGDGALAPSMSDYRHADELTALVSPRVAAAMDAMGLARGGFSDVFPATVSPVEPALRTL
ncbi:Chitooligosaccharide deacetylase [Caballeronia sp. SBC1]|uniref:hopanoid biosynthesis-associated protein HpnK n=1 Tax=unclassified Caballeronia TaxID=2646786 RepID=UPI0013E0F3C5|nr:MULTISPECIES: hopanoid biosynthesis-associated protein HpnK [unclassified Caballeronia]QIE23904.1 Chitooligosaccharide deacetylase [Caballeronia sp. SBC2]QIN61800.1 Chitooligosaccharide deacetylase [Caballeronia sp. SBC1]